VIGDDAFLNEVASHLIDAGGKRLRPSLAIAASYLRSDDVTTEILLGGVSVELVHSLALSRRCHGRGDPAAQRRERERRWGNLVAIVPVTSYSPGRRRSRRDSVPRSPNCSHRRSPGSVRDKWPRCERRSRSSGTSMTTCVASPTRLRAHVDCVPHRCSDRRPRPTQIDDSRLRRAVRHGLSDPRRRSRRSSPPRPSSASRLDRTSPRDLHLPGPARHARPCVGPRLRDLLGTARSSRAREARVLVAASRASRRSRDRPDYARAAARRRRGSARA